MAKRIGLLIVAVVILLGTYGTAASAHTKTSYLQEGTDQAAVLFDPLKPFTVSVMHQIGEPALTHKFLNSPVYRHATVKITMSGTKKYTVLYNVGVRLKGSYTRKFEKMSLKIRFDAFVKGQTFMGLKRLTLNAMMQDESQIREVTAYKLFRAMGVPASRAGYARVRIDGAYQGLYLNLESVDSTMLKHWFDSTEHLFSGKWPCDLTPTNSCYVTSLGNSDRTDVLTAGKLHLLSGKAWWQAFQEASDSERVLRFLATEIVLSHWDGYGDYMRNNHYVHFDKDGHFTLIPWGMDQTFPSELKHQLTWDASKPVYLGRVTERSSLITHCLAYRPCHDRLLYFGYLASQTANNIDLTGFKDKIVAKISQRRFAINDTSKIPQNIRVVQRKWITDYLPVSRKGLLNFLLLRSPAQLQVVMPETLNIQKSAKPTLQSVWEPGVTVSYQWMLDGKPIEGATNTTYKILDEQLGHKIKLRITLKKAAVKDTVYFSSTKKVLAKALTKTPIPTIEGKAVIGKILKVISGTWDSQVTLNIQWLRNGNPISGATKSAYKISKLDFDQHITVKVTGSKPTFASVTRTSEPTKKVR